MGAAYAYEAADLLISMGKTVRGIVIIDPCPLNCRAMKPQTLALLEEVGVFAELERISATTQGMVKRHFEASIRTLERYKPSPFGKKLAALIVHGRDGVLQRLTEDESHKTWRRYQQENGDDEAWIFYRDAVTRLTGGPTLFSPQSRWRSRGIISRS